METVATPKGAHDWDTLKEPTLCAAFQRMWREVPDRVALRSIGGDVEITFSEYAERVESIARGLAAMGVDRGDTVGIMLTNRPEFHLVDTAVIHLAAVPFSLYNTNPAEEIEWLIRDAKPGVLITETAFADRVLEVARRVDGLTVVLIDPPSGGQAAVPEGAITLAELEAKGDAGFDFEAAWKACESESIITLIYTSGTTGEPKAVEHSHRSILFNLTGFHALAPIAPEARLVSFLPMAHIAERIISHYAQMAFGYEITSCPDPKQVGAAFVDARPTRLFAVPRIFEKIKSALDAAMADQPPMRAAVDVGLKRVKAEQAGEEVSAGLAAECAQADEAVLSKIRAKVGLDQLDYVAVAAAPTPYHVLEFWHAIGVPVCELWGMSEVILATSNPPDAIKLGTVGKAIPGVEIKLADDGEIMVKGDNLFSSYRGRPDLYEESVKDGWMLTGDIAQADEDGYLTIVDRKKELIINAAGKNMSPAKIEGVLKEGSNLIGQAVVVGDMRPYNVALLVLDPDAAAAWGKANDMEGASTEEVAKDERVRAEIEAGVAKANDRLARVEQIKYFELLPAEWLPGGDELTPTSKLKRKPIAAKYEAAIEKLYDH